MDRQMKVRNFLIGGGLALAGLAGMVVGSIKLFSYLIGGILGFLGLNFLLNKSNNSGGWLFLGLGVLFLSGPILGFNILGFNIALIIGLISLITGGYILYRTYKTLNH